MLGAGALIAALAGCTTPDPALDGVPPEQAVNAESAEMAWDASPDVPSEFSDATGAEGI
jgi:hypothetical protein